MSARAWGPVFASGGVRFRLWAPDEENLHLHLNGRDFPMERLADGWFEAFHPDARPGDGYGFRLGDGALVPDPASRAQLDDVHGLSRVVDPEGYRWQTDWKGRPWHEAVIYEIHVGAFTPEGTFAAAAEKLHNLASIGVTAVEIMPVAQFAGSRGWGYDGVLLYAPHPAYGTPEDLKALVDAAHAAGLMVLLDVVFNHFGPEGNYLPSYASEFFVEERHTPWGAAIAYERPAVRRFFTDCALYWLEEFRFDGLRLDAVDHIHDPDSPTEILVEVAETVRCRFPDALVHLTTEDNRNITWLHERAPDGSTPLYTAEWNDDFHNVAHAIATGEAEGYYADFADHHWAKFARVLAEGFAYQGEVSPHAGAPRGHPSGQLPPTAFVDFLQNHDQIGNRAFGERLLALSSPPMVRALTTILLLSPHIPLLFMGEEWGETRPFAFFTDFHGDLADAVREGRRREFRQFAAFEDRDSRARIPDPNDQATFASSRIDWDARFTAEGSEWLAFVEGLLRVRRSEIMPYLAGARGNSGRIVSEFGGGLAIDWQLGGARLALRANLSEAPAVLPEAAGRTIYTIGNFGPDAKLGSFAVRVALEESE